MECRVYNNGRYEIVQCTKSAGGITMGAQYEILRVPKNYNISTDRTRCEINDNFKNCQKLLEDKITPSTTKIKRKSSVAYEPRDQ